MRARSSRLLVICGAGAMLAGVVPAAPASARALVSPGTTLWTQQYTDAFGGAATDVSANPRSPIVYVTGWTATARHVPGHPHQTVDDFTTVAYNTLTGAQVWAASYEGSGRLGEGNPLVTVSPDGSEVYVAGDACAVGPCLVYRHGVQEEGDVALAYQASTGALLWATTGNVNSPSQITATQNGLFVTSPDYGATFFTAAGVELWSAHNQMPYCSRGCYPSAVAASPDGSTVFVTGTRGTVAFAAGDGAVLWQRYVATAVGFSLVVSQDSATLLIAGCHPPLRPPRCPSTMLAAFDAVSGLLLWKLADGAQWVIASPHGPEVFVASDNSGHYMITAYDVVNGVRTQLWRTTSISGQLAVSRNGAKVIAGLGTSSVAAYNAANGATLWATSYNYPGGVRAMTVNAGASELFVTGDSGSASYLTLAYRL
jgi:hypothetical protein